jgi:hypothetical protein
MNAHVLLLIIATICWALAALFGFWKRADGVAYVNVNLEALGLMFYGLSLLIR